MDNPKEFTLESTLSKKTLVNTVVLWLFVTFVAACAYMPEGEKQSYPFNEFFWFFISASVVFSFVGYIKFATRINLALTKDSLIISNAFKTPKSKYSLTDIIDFSWSSRPYNSVSRYGTVRLRKEYFVITLKNETAIKIKGDEFENYQEFQKYFFSYCKKNDININSIGRRD
jgi:hypothetical protein